MDTKKEYERIAKIEDKMRRLDGMLYLIYLEDFIKKQNAHLSAKQSAKRKIN